MKPIVEIVLVLIDKLPLIGKFINSLKRKNKRKKPPVNENLN